MRTRWIIGGALLLACAAFARLSTAALPPATTVVCQQHHSDDADEWVALEQVIAAQEQHKRAVGTAQKKVKEALAQTRKVLNATAALDLYDDLLHQGQWINLLGVPDTRVNLDLKDAPIREALKQLFEQAKQEYELEKDVPEDIRITLQVKSVRFGTALNLITEAAGIRWGRQIKNGKSIFRLGKSVRPGISAFYDMPEVSGFVTHVTDITPEPLVYSLSLSEERASFTCPHCKGQVTTLRQRVQPKCPKCDRTFRSDWQFCPYDGSKRPPTPGAWKFCPLCGKPVDLEKPEEKKER